MFWPYSVAGFAFWSLIQGVQAYLNGEGFQVTPFGIAIIGIVACGNVDEAGQVDVVQFNYVWNCRLRWK